MMIIQKMKIGELEEISGVPKHTIRYYIQEGMIKKPEKTGKTMAYYDAHHLKRLKQILNIQQEYKFKTKKSYMPIKQLKHHLAEADQAVSVPKDHPSNVNPDFEKRKRRKKEIVDAAMKLYAEKGYYDTHVRDIAREAGISPATFYIYFTDKRELFSEVIDNVVKTATEHIRKKIQKAKDPLKILTNFLEAYRDMYPYLGEILNQLRAGLAIRDEWAIRKLGNVAQNLHTAVTTKLLSTGNINTEIDVDAELAGYFMIAIAEVVIQIPTMYDRYTYEQLSLYSARLITHGILASREKSDQIDPKIKSDTKSFLDSRVSE